MIDYSEFVKRKQRESQPCGFDPPSLNRHLKKFQRDLVRWALRRGRAALFEECGLGKTLQQLDWAHRVAKFSDAPVIILAPLAVTAQTVREGERFGIDVKYARTGEEADGPIVITNYERIGSFDVSKYAGVVLDESSILKSYDGSTRTAIIDAFGRTPYRLACTATPAPNDHMELGNHAEFLGVMSRQEMLASFFVHDGGETQSWRLKGHAEAEFWRWVCSWAVMLRSPRDLGYEDDGYDLPPLRMHQHTVAVDHATTRKAGMLFALEATTLDEQRAAKRASIGGRVATCAKLANDDRGEQWLIWCELNDEGDALTKAIDGAAQIAGSDTLDEKEQRILDFTAGKIRVLVTKPKIAGFGVNLQNCAREAFVGVSHSFEQTYQAIRRCWRFGQTRPVDVHFVSSELEGAVVANLRRKEADAERMAASMLTAMSDVQLANVRGQTRESIPYNPTATMAVPEWCATGPDDGDAR